MSGYIKRLEELYDYSQRGQLSPDQNRRVLIYVAARYKWLFDWINEKD